VFEIRKKLKKGLCQCYVSGMILWTAFIYCWCLKIFIEIVFFLFNNFSHIISERNFNVQKNPPGFFGDGFSYNMIASVLLWRLTLDVHKMYLIAKKCKLTWYDFLDGSWNNGTDSFFDRLVAHFFFFVPWAANSKDDN
jgi:hypothetical protein